MSSIFPQPQGAQAPDVDYLRRAQELAPELEAAAEDIERRRELPDPIVEALIERGFFRLLLPRTLGGAELPPAAYVRVIEEVAMHDASTAWCLGQACGCTMTSAYLDPDVACEIFGGKRGIVAWGPPGPAEARAACVEALQLPAQSHQKPEEENYPEPTCCQCGVRQPGPRNLGGRSAPKWRDQRRVAVGESALTP